MKIKKISLVCFFLFGMLGFAQNKTIQKADKNYDRFLYVDAINTYEKVAKKGYKSIQLFCKLGDSYYFQSRYAEANQWYEQLFLLQKKVAAEYYFRYAQTLKSIGNYDKAAVIMQAFDAQKNTDLRAKLAQKQVDYLAQIKKNSGRYRIKNAGINSKYSDYGAAFYKNMLVFTSARDTGGLFVRKHNWNNQSFTNLYGTEIQDTTLLRTPENFSKKTNSKYHESTPVFTSDGNTMYFTRNNYVNGKKGKDQKNTILLKIFKATKVDEKWENIVELPFNGNQYNCAHPALSLDEKTLYFSSNMPGSFGMSDLYKVALLHDGGYGKPINLGPQINTEARESFPFISKANELYFASDGHPGLGGLDVFVTQLGADGKPNVIQNIGAPVNSTFDDFAMIFDVSSKIGYFSSNRTNDTMGDDDIFQCVELYSLPRDCQQSLFGTVVDAVTQKPLASVQLVLMDPNLAPIKETITDAAGKFEFGPVDCDTFYSLRANLNDYDVNEIRIASALEAGKTEIKVDLSPKILALKIGDDLRKALGIDIIHFDLDKDFIRPDAAVELAKILEVMQQNPTLEIDVRSHTDSRQTHLYNIQLSNRRAKSTIQWLVTNGIDARRLSGKGYGETQLVNPCADGVSCTEEAHQANRRSEFIITKL
jgi:outer membrane protein OmpA-like peptidoglycan-associated protein/tetratricopeptide (TPR) repeat protein